MYPYLLPEPHQRLLQQGRYHHFFCRHGRQRTARHTGCSWTDWKHCCTVSTGDIDASTWAALAARGRFGRLSAPCFCATGPCRPVFREDPEARKTLGSRFAVRQNHSIGRTGRCCLTTWKKCFWTGLSVDPHAPESSPGLLRVKKMPGSCKDQATRSSPAARSGLIGQPCAATLSPPSSCE